MRKRIGPQLRQRRNRGGADKTIKHDRDALAKLRADTLAHALSSHVSAEAGHRMLLDELTLRPLLDLDLRLGEASGAALAVLVLRAALACHTGMATFAEAGVSDRPAADDATAAAAS